MDLYFQEICKHDGLAAIFPMHLNTGIRDLRHGEI